jgi:double-stranded uracil-DNA glycosylase
VKCGLAPLANTDARILILGSLPGDESIRQQQYYAHPQNQFWVMLASVYGETLYDAYARRISLIARHELAVWDVLNSAERAGSLDTAIRNAVPNDFSVFFARHKRLEAIAFNGQKAHALYKRYIAKSDRGPSRTLRTAVMPSTSPAYTISVEKKIAQWRAFLTGSDQPLNPSAASRP